MEFLGVPDTGLSFGMGPLYEADDGTLRGVERCLQGAWPDRGHTHGTWQHVLSGGGQYDDLHLAYIHNEGTGGVIACALLEYRVGRRETPARPYLSRRRRGAFRDSRPRGPGRGRSVAIVESWTRIDRGAAATRLASLSGVGLVR